MTGFADYFDVPESTKRLWRFGVYIMMAGQLFLFFVGLYMIMHSGFDMFTKGLFLFGYPILLGYAIWVFIIRPWKQKRRS